MSIQSIIFLDFDGVLHPEGVGEDLHFYYLPGFEALLHEHQDLDIVITSAWRLNTSLEQLRNIFSEDLRARIIGVTPDLVDYIDERGQRQREIEAWLTAHAPNASWLAVDDRESYFDVGCENLFLVPYVMDDGVGLDEDQIEMLRERLCGIRREEVISELQSGAGRR